MTPATGSTLGGTAVVLKGTGFLEGSTVTIGSKAVEVEVVSETEIKAKTAATAAGKDEVVVGYADGVVSTGGPTYAYVAPPKVTSISPTEGSTAGGTAVKIKGTGFLKGSTVAIGGGEATSVVVVSETEITAKTAATAAGKDEVVVSDTSGPSTAGPSFTFVTPPTVASIEPSSGTTLGGTSVTIKGTGFLSGSTVTIGAAATSVVVVSEKEITAKTAAGAAGKDEVVVSYANGVASTGGPDYTYVTPPSVTSVTPAEGSTLGGTSLKIKGTGFVEGATVKIGSETTGVTVVSSTEITATTAATAAGKDEVVVTDEKGVSSGGSSFTYVAPPKVTSVEPSAGSTAGGTAVKIKGSGFLKGSTVKIGSEATSVVIVSETEITAKTAAGAAGKDEVVVTDVGGSSTEGPKFTYVTPPTVASVTPATGSTLGGTAVVLKGTGFLEGSTVTIG
ncbi:MAG: IPT/TIG domain-containing protein, partial [Solirubrobacteraceae bacterium]